MLTEKVDHLIREKYIPQNTKVTTNPLPRGWNDYFARFEGLEFLVDDPSPANGGITRITADMRSNLIVTAYRGANFFWQKEIPMPEAEG